MDQWLTVPDFLRNGGQLTLPMDLGKAPEPLPAQTEAPKFAEPKPATPEDKARLFPGYLRRHLSESLGDPDLADKPAGYRRGWNQVKFRNVLRRTAP